MALSLTKFNLLTNKRCLLCQQSSNTLICQVCHKDLLLFDLQACQFDLLNYPAIYRDMQKTLVAVQVERLIAINFYHWPFSSLLSDFKHNKKGYCGKLLADLFVETLGDRQDWWPELLLPIPLFWRRWMKRHFNQSLEAVKWISDQTEIPWRADHLRRIKHTQTQQALSKAQRAKNMQSAFECDPLTKINRIALFDDVVTTGATLQSAVKSIRRSNPDIQIQIWSFCVTPAQPSTISDFSQWYKINT
jgi:ComF family protein